MNQLEETVARFSDCEGNRQFLVFCSECSKERTGRPFQKPLRQGRRIGFGCGKTDNCGRTLRICLFP